MFYSATLQASDVRRLINDITEFPTWIDLKGGVHVPDVCLAFQRPCSPHARTATGPANGARDFRLTRAPMFTPMFTPTCRNPPATRPFNISCAPSRPRTGSRSHTPVVPAGPKWPPMASTRPVRQQRGPLAQHRDRPPPPRAYFFRVSHPAVRSGWQAHAGARSRSFARLCAGPERRAAAA